VIINAWSYIYRPPYAFTASLLMKQSDNWKLTFTVPARDTCQHCHGRSRSIGLRRLTNTFSNNFPPT
jgi:hypothetical protein